MKISFDDFSFGAYNIFQAIRKAAAMDREKLLQEKEVVEEINRHKWLRSELVGYDIGFEEAASDWFKNYAPAWVAHHNKDCRSKCKK